MEGQVMRTLNPRSFVMNHHDPGMYGSFCSPLSFYQTGRGDKLTQSQKERIENELSLASDQMNQDGQSETASNITFPKIHFAKWYDNKSETNRNGSGGSQRSSSLSPKATQPTVNLAHRPPTPLLPTSNPTSTHRGILKGQRPPLDAPAATGRGFWDSVDISSDVNSSSNSIASSNLTESLSRKTVRFADGKPTVTNKITQTPYDYIRSTATRTIGPITQGEYEWESGEGSTVPSRVMGGLNKPPRPPKLRPMLRTERRVTTDCIGLSSGLRCFSGGHGAPGVGSALPAGFPTLRAAVGANTETDSYANCGSIYRNGETRLFSGSAQIEGTDIGRSDVLIRPDAMDSDCPSLISSLSSPPPPPSTTSGGPIYRSEIQISDFPQPPSQSTLNPLPPASVSPPPLHFVYASKPLPSRCGDGGNLEKAIANTESATIDDAALKPSHALLTQDNCQQQAAALAQQRKRYLPLRVDVSQAPILKAPLFLNGNSLSPIHVTDSPHHRGKGLVDPPQALGVTDLKTGSLDRDGIWRPNRNGSGAVGNSSSPVSQSLVYPPSFLLADLMEETLSPERRHFRHAPHLFSTAGLGVGYEVPIFVIPSTITSSPTTLPTCVSPAFHRQAITPKRIGVQGVNVPIKRI